jgi:hypothetical protein
LALRFATNIEESPVTLNRVGVGFDVYAAVLLLDLVYGERVEGRGVFNIAGSNVEACYQRGVIRS